MYCDAHLIPHVAAQHIVYAYRCSTDSYNLLLVVGMAQNVGLGGECVCDRMVRSPQIANVPYGEFEGVGDWDLLLSDCDVRFGLHGSLNSKLASFRWLGYIYELISRPKDS